MKVTCNREKLRDALSVVNNVVPAKSTKPVLENVCFVALDNALEIIGTRYADEPGAATVLAMLEKNLNCPRTSSAGRLFDAASGLVGLCRKMEMDAEAAIRLEQAATRRIDATGWPEPAADGWRLVDGVLDLRPLLVQLADMAYAEQGAALFHATLVAALAHWAERACVESGLDTVVFGGGCFFNRLLSSGLRGAVEARGLRVLAPIQLVPGDSGLALGQAWVALHWMENRGELLRVCGLWVIGMAGYSPPLMSSVGALWAPPPPLLRCAEHPTLPIRLRWRWFSVARLRRIQPRMGGIRLR